MKAFAVVWFTVMALLVAAPTSHAANVDQLAWMIVGAVVLMLWGGTRDA